MKYMGSKARFIKDILPIILKNCGEWSDLRMGGFKILIQAFESKYYLLFPTQHILKI